MDLKLLDAARLGKLQIFKDLGNDPKRNIYDETTPEGNTVLHMAARYGSIPVVKEIVKQRSSLVLKGNRKGETPVHIAARAGQSDVVEHFIKSLRKFPSVYIGRIRDNFGNTPWHGAVRNGHGAVVEALARVDKDSLVLINDAGESPLSIAIDTRLTGIAERIIVLNESTLQFIGHNGQTVLHHVVLRNDSDTMELILLSTKAFVKVKLDEKRDETETEIPLFKVQDENKRTPLHYAAALGHTKMVDKLLKKEASVAYLGDNNEQIPLHLAAKNGQKSLVKMLLERCPDTIEIVDNKRRSILHIAAKTGNLDVVSHILKLDEMNDLINSPDADGNTPLHLATSSYHSDVVRALCKNPRVEIRAINNDNQTALAIVKLPNDRGMELQKHLTLKALKRGYELKAIYPEDTQFDDVEVEKASQDGNKKGREMAQIISVMSTLIATFTFTAAFTIPGGFKSDDDEKKPTPPLSPSHNHKISDDYAGMAVLISKSAFHAFVISDTIAMTSSITSAVIVFWSMSRRDTESFMDTLPYAIGLTWISLLAMAVAFVTGLFVVLKRTLWLAILVIVLGCASPFSLYIFAPSILLIYDRFSKSKASVTNRRNIVDDNPFLFIVQLVRIYGGSLIHKLCNRLRSVCKRPCSCCTCTHTCCSKGHVLC